MKKYSYLFAVLVLLTSGSCKKSYTCQCTSSPYIMTTMTTEMKASKRSQAEAVCLENNNSINGTHDCHLID